MKNALYTSVETELLSKIKGISKSNQYNKSH